MVENIDDIEDQDQGRWGLYTTASLLILRSKWFSPPFYTKYQLSARCPSTYLRHTSDILNIRDTSQIQTLCPFWILYIRDAYAYILPISVLLTMDNVPCTFSFLLLSKAKARSHCTYGCKEDAKRKKDLVIRWKNAMHPLCTHCIRVSYDLSIERPSTVISSAQRVLSCTKLLERMDFPPCTM